MKMDQGFWRGKKVLITGNTGFKGCWLSLWLITLGAEVQGFALAPETEPNLFTLTRLEELVPTIIGDIRNATQLDDAIQKSGPEIVFHLAAQSLVRRSYLEPVLTFETNLMGTVHLLEAVRRSPTVRVIVNITSDKCYENKEWIWGYRETEPLGGYDPYSSSKAGSEIITAAYRNSFFPPGEYHRHGVAVATSRSGNVFGGGDWAADRLIPDCFRAILSGEPVRVRNPQSVRPWQHVLEPLSGYLLLAEKLEQDGPKYGEAWNFGPEDSDAKEVEWIVKKLCDLWGEGAGYRIDNRPHPHETRHLKLDCTRTKTMIGWHPRWNLIRSLEKTVAWYRAYQTNSDLRPFCLQQIEEFQESFSSSS